jgi:hypothetical protein
VIASCVTYSEKTLLAGAKRQTQTTRGFFGRVVADTSRVPSEDIMKKRFNFFSFAATVAAFALIAWSSMLAQSSPAGQDPTPQAQQVPTQPPDTQAPARPQPGQQTPSQAQPAPPMDQSQPTSDTSGSKEFVGTVVKQGDKYVFQDAVSGTTYDIDHQDEVKKFEGKKVRVHGTLDGSGKMIHVQ